MTWFVTALVVVGVVVVLLGILAEGTSARKRARGL
jgi:hypothetical protein